MQGLRLITGQEQPYQSEHEYLESIQKNLVSKNTKNKQKMNLKINKFS